MEKFLMCLIWPTLGDSSWQICYWVCLLFAENDVCFLVLAMLFPYQPLEGRRRFGKLASKPIIKYWCWCFSISVQFSSVAQFCLTLCNPMDCSTPGFPVHQQPPELAQTHAHRVGDAIQPSHLLSSPSPPDLNLFQHQGLFQWVSSSHQVAKVLGVSMSASVLLMNIQGWFSLGLTGLISLQCHDVIKRAAEDERASLVA